ncbi:MAG: hypothetical protein IPO21_19245 [Bacteroidales bacterium]|nr:hypothetical protein [Bacteroidales bacterium]
MLQINYPKNKIDLNLLHQKYVSAICSNDMEDKLEEYFNQRTLIVPNAPTLEKLLLMSIEELLRESKRIGKYIKTDVQLKKLKKIINYDKAGKGYISKKQPKIAKFFSDNDNKIKLVTCYYCNIDYINAFPNIGDYKDNLHFVNKARKFELTAIKGIDDTNAKIIMNYRIKKK